MFIPEWVFWIIGIVSVLALANFVATPRGDYDFVSPLLGLGIILIALAFIIGLLI